MNIIELKEQLSSLRIEKQSFLNDTHLWVNVARNAIRDLPGEKLVFQVPKAGKPLKNTMISRKNREIVVDRIVKKDIFNSAFVTIITSIEDYLNKIMKLILQFDSRRLKFTIPEVKMITNISVIEFIDNSRDDMIDKIIKQRLESLFYASPQKQLEYLDKSLGIKLEEELWGKWIESKARRDLVVHNGGVVNDIYLKKAGKFALLNLGNQAIIDEDYFRNTIADLKRMVGTIDRLVKEEYNIPKNKEMRKNYSLIETAE